VTWANNLSKIVFNDITSKLSLDFKAYKNNQKKAAQFLSELPFNSFDRLSVYLLLNQPCGFVWWCFVKQKFDYCFTGITVGSYPSQNLLYAYLISFIDRYGT
jgi:hypothetical protein